MLTIVAGVVRATLTLTRIIITPAQLPFDMLVHVHVCLSLVPVLVPLLPVHFLLSPAPLDTVHMIVGLIFVCLTISVQSLTSFVYPLFPLLLRLVVALASSPINVELGRNLRLVFGSLE